MQNMKGRIFRIQRFSVHDGYGIRTTVFFKGCPLKCIWCHNPESQKFEPEICYKIEKCLSCHRCAEVCERGAIIPMDVGIRLDKEKCDGCGRCVEACRGNALEIFGEDFLIDDVIALIKRDRVFYENSGGGVTFSGGEPYFQPDFLIDLLKKCKAEGINTAVDTSGYTRWELIEKSLPFVDFFLYDVKDYRSERHRKMCGVDNEIIISNLRKLVDSTEVIVRIPVVPGYNFSRGDFEGYLKLLEDTGVDRIDILPYHPLAKDKYRWLNRNYLSEIPEMVEKAKILAGEFANLLKRKGFDVTTGGYF